MASSSRQANLGRIGEIVQVAVRHGFGYLLDERRGRGGDEEWVTSRGRHLREMLDELGPTFVKFGQLLSTRPDVMPPDMIAELRQLQDAVTPFGYPEIERVIREELGQPIERLFLEFDPEPLAAASIGQVHRAVLPNGRKVVVKVQRPDAPARIESDLSLMRQLAGFVKERVKALEFIDVGEIVDEFARSIRQELDYRQEARNADAFYRNFAGNKHVVVPRTYWSYTRERVLTLEYLEGVQLRDIERLIKQDIPQEVIAGFEPDPKAKAEPILQRQGRGQGQRNGQRQGRGGGHGQPAAQKHAQHQRQGQPQGQKQGQKQGQAQTHAQKQGQAVHRGAANAAAPRPRHPNDGAARPQHARQNAAQPRSHNAAPAVNANAKPAAAHHAKPAPAAKAKTVYRFGGRPR